MDLSRYMDISWQIYDVGLNEPKRRLKRGSDQLGSREKLCWIQSCPCGSKSTLQLATACFRDDFGKDWNHPLDDKILVDH